MEIIFAGGSHYGLGAYKSIQKFFDKIYILDTCDDIIKVKRLQDDVISDFNSVPCKYIFLAGYPKLITKEQLNLKTYINVHGALLPKYRGMHSTFYAIMNGEKKLGITFHLVNEFMDAGDIIAKFSFDYIGQEVEKINNKIDLLVEENAGQVIYKYITGQIEAVKQDKTLACYGYRRNLDDCLIDFNMNNIMLERFFKALTKPYPMPMLMIRGEKYEVLDHLIIKNDYYGFIGRVATIDEQGVWIKTAEGFLVIRNVRKYGTDITIDLSSLVGIGYRLYLH